MKKGIKIDFYFTEEQIPNHEGPNQGYEQEEELSFRSCDFYFS